MSQVAEHAIETLGAKALEGELTPQEPAAPVMIRDIELAIKSEIEALDPAGPMDPIIAIHHKAQFLKQVATALVKLTEAKMVEGLKAHGEERRPAEVNVGPMRYYVGTTTTTKPRSHKAIMDTILELSGGDDDKIGECLSANAWKYGTVRTLIEEHISRADEAASKFNELFEVKAKDSLEEGKPAKGLKCVNQNFVTRSV